MRQATFNCKHHPLWSFVHFLGHRLRDTEAAQEGGPKYKYEP